MELLSEGRGVVRDILLLIRDHPNDVFMIHCSMGKDRTGIIFAVLLSLAGVSNGSIASEYSLSEASLKSTLPRITAGIKNVLSPPMSDAEAQKRAEIVIQARCDNVLDLSMY
jgi:hypothetical protein